MIGAFKDFYQRHAARRMFSRWAPIYEAEVADNAYSAAERVAGAALKQAGEAGLKNPAIIDAGIGTGLLSQQIYDSLPCHITGLDFTEDMLALCGNRDIATPLIKCDVGRDFWPCADQSADMVVSAGLLEYLTEPMTRHFMAQAARVLRPGGFLVFTYLPAAKPGASTSLWRGHSGTYLTCAVHPAMMESMLAGFDIRDHSPPFAGSVFQDGSSYDYRLIAARRA